MESGLKRIKVKLNEKEKKIIRETSPQTPFIQLAGFIGKARIT